MRRYAHRAGALFVLSTISTTAATPDQLYQAWQQNDVQQPEVAEKAAEDYLRIAPRGAHAHDLQVWLDAYHKALASLGLTESRVGAGSAPDNNQAVVQPIRPKQPQPSKGQQTDLADLKPAGQSLEETLAFIRDKLALQGNIKFMAQFRSSADNRNLVEHLSYRARNVTIDPNQCQLSFHWHVEQDGKATPDQDRVVQFRLAKSVRVETLDQALAEVNAAAGDPLSVSTHPQAYAIHVARKDNALGNNLYLHDEDTASQVGKAAQHALELCSDRAKEQLRHSRER